jgi:hypothetical protein
MLELLAFYVVECVFSLDAVLGYKPTLNIMLSRLNQDYSLGGDWRSSQICVYTLGLVWMLLDLPQSPCVGMGLILPQYMWNDMNPNASKQGLR